MTRDELVFWVILVAVVIWAIYYFKLVPRGAPWWNTTVIGYDATGEAVDVHGVPFNWINASR